MIPLLLTFAATLPAGFLLPWWGAALPGIAVGFWTARRPVRAFFATAAGAGLAWLAVALWFDLRNDGLLSGRVAPLFHLPGEAGLLAATAVVGGLTSALGALFGVRFRRFWTSLQEALAAVAAPVPAEDDAGEAAAPRGGSGLRPRGPGE